MCELSSGAVSPVIESTVIVSISVSVMVNGVLKKVQPPYKSRKGSTLKHQKGMSRREIFIVGQPPFKIAASVLMVSESPMIDDRLDMALASRSFRDRALSFSFSLFKRWLFLIVILILT